MKRSVYVQILAVVLAIPALQAQSDVVARAQGFVAQQKYEDALKVYDEAIRKDPTYAAFHLNRGLVQLKLKKWKEALNDCTAAMQLMRPTPEVHYCRGAAYQNTGKNELARESLQRALAMNPNHAGAIETMAAVSRKGKNRDQALESLSEVIRINPEKPGAYLERARLYEKGGDLLGALEDYSTAVRLEAKEASIVARAEVLTKLGEFDRAIAAYTEMLRKAPSTAGLLAGRGKAYLLKGDDIRAQNDFNSAKRLNPSFAHITWQIQASAPTLRRQIAEVKANAEALAAARQTQPPPSDPPQQVAATPVASTPGPQPAPEVGEAVTPSRTLVLTAKKPATTPAEAPQSPTVASKPVEQPVEVAKTTPPPAKVVPEPAAPVAVPPTPTPSASTAADATMDAVRRHLEEASNHVRAKQPDQAIAAYSEALKLKADLPATWADRARLQMQLGKMDLAIADFGESLKHNPKQPEVYLQRCKAKMQANDHKGAIPDCTQAVQLNPKLTDAILARAQAYYATRQFVAAAQDLEDSLEKKTETPDAHLQLGQIYIELEQYVLALHHFTVAAQQRPGFKDAFKFRAIVKQSLGDQLGYELDMARAKS